MPRPSPFRVSSRSQNLLALIKSRTGLDSGAAGRLALCLSLGDPSPPNPDEFDEKGSEIRPSDLFGEYEDVLVALMLMRLGDEGLDPDKHFDRAVRAHLNRGAVALFARVRALPDLGRVVAQEREARAG